MPVKVTCACNQSATHRTDTQAWDDIYHLDTCEAQDMSFFEADMNGFVHVSMLYSTPAAA